MRRIAAFIVAALAAACAVGASGPEEQGEGGDVAEKRFPMSWDYPPGTMERFAFTAAGESGWRLSALRTPERAEAPWKIVIVTGTPSWSEYWAPTIAALAPTREIVVADRPGFAASEPKDAVRDIAAQAEALAPMLEAREGQRVVLLGQSFGASIAILMAEAHPEDVDALVLLSAYFGERGPTARRMYGVGRVMQWALPRDLKNSITEVRYQRDQLPGVFAALEKLDQPVLFVHGDADTFITPAAAEAAAERFGRPLVTIPGGDHFLNACCVAGLLDAVEQAIVAAEAE